MRYNIDFDIAALFINTILILLACCRKNHRSVMNLSFRLMLISHLLANIFDIVSSIALISPNNYSIVYHYIINILYFLFHNYCAFLYVVYGLTSDGERTGNRKTRLFFMISSIVIFLLIITTPFTKLIFYFDDALLYHQGPLLYLLYGFGLVSVIFVLYLKLSNKEQHSTFQIIANFVYTIALFLAFFYHAVINPIVLIEMFAIDCGFLVMYVSQDNPDLFLYKTINVYNKRAFDESLRARTLKSTGFQVLIFTPKNVEQCKRQFVGSRLFSFEKALINTMRVYGRKTNFYVLSELCFAIITNDYQKTIMEIDKSLAGGIHVNNKLYTLEMSYAIMRYPEIASNYNDATIIVDDLMYRISTQASSKPLEANPNILLTSKRKSIENILIDAIKNDKLIVEYEPIFAKDSEYALNAEATLKIKNGNTEIYVDSSYYDIADDDGLIIDLDEIMLKKVGAFIKKTSIKNIGINNIIVSLSTSELMNIHFVNRLNEMIQKYDIPCNHICFKIVDLDLSINEDIIRTNMMKINDLGFKFVVDKYGNSQINLTKIVELPIAGIKISEELLKKSITNSNQRTILKSLVKLIQKLGFSVDIGLIASVKEAKLVESIGFDFWQGPFYANTLNEDKFMKFYKEQWNQLLSNVNNK